MPRSARYFGNYHKYAGLAAILPWLANFLASFFVTRWVMNKVMDLAPERELPTFANQRFSRWFDRRPDRSRDPEFGTVWLYVDPFTEFNEPEVGRAAVELLEAAGYAVELLPVEDDGRTHLSKGLVREAKELSNENLRTLAPLLEEHPDRPIVGLEPSALLTFRDETPDLVEPSLKAPAEELADRALLLEEFVEEATLEGEFGATWRELEDAKVQLHGHCHQKALVGTEPTERALQLAGYEVETIPSGCCGMAGSFGYERDHYEISMQIGELVLFPALREADEADLVAAPGTSCRHQIADGTGDEALHPAVLLKRALS